MSDHHDPQDLDALASAYLDGLTSPEETAQVEADPALVARVASLRSVRDVLRSIDPPADPARREQAIAAALDAFDRQAPASVTSLAEVAERRARDPRWLKRAAVVAAVALLALMVPFLDSLDTGSQQEAFETTGAAIGDDAAQEGADGLSTTLAPMGGAEAAPPPTDLGAFDDVASLARTVGSRTAATLDASTESDTPAASNRDLGYELGSSCDVGSDVSPDWTIVLRATATLAGRPVDVVAYRQPNGDRVLLVVDRADCSVTSTTI